MRSHTSNIEQSRYLPILTSASGLEVLQAARAIPVPAVVAAANAPQTLPLKA